MKNLQNVLLILIFCLSSLAQNPDPGPRPTKKITILGDAPDKNANLYFLKCKIDSDITLKDGTSAYSFEPKKYGTKFVLDQFQITHPSSVKYYAITCNLNTFLAGKAKVGENAWPIKNDFKVYSPLRIKEKKFTIVCLYQHTAFGFLEVDTEKYKHKDGFYLPMEIKVPMHYGVSQGERPWRGKEVKLTFKKGETVKGYDLFLGKEVDPKTSLRSSSSSTAIDLDSYNHFKKIAKNPPEEASVNDPCADLIFKIEEPLIGKTKLKVLAETDVDGLFLLPPHRMIHTPIFKERSFWGFNYPIAPINGYNPNFVKQLATEKLPVEDPESFHETLHFLTFRVRSKHHGQYVRDKYGINGFPAYYGGIPSDIKFSKQENGEYTVEFKYVLSVSGECNIWPDPQPSYNVFKVMEMAEAAQKLTREEAKALAIKFRKENKEFEEKAEAIEFREQPYPQDSDVKIYQVTAPLTEEEKEIFYKGMEILRGEEK